VQLVLDRYKISMHRNLHNKIDVFLLPVADNISNINLDIIPQEQINDINKYHQQSDRNKKLIARSFLFGYCQSHYNINQFDFSYNKYKQPRFEYSPVKFSLSYSGEYILIGISKCKEIGVDIEQKSNELEYTEMAPLVMHKKELKLFYTLSNQDKVNYFYTLWSSKEALVKALGKGFYFSITEIELQTNRQIFFDESIYCHENIAYLTDYAVSIAYTN